MVDAPPELREAESPDRNRAQLILVGAVALAVVVLGLVVVFNTVLYTENVASSGSVNAPQEAQQVNREARFGTQELIHRVNTGYNWTDRDNLSIAVSENVTAYSSGVTNVTAASKPAFVSYNVRFSPDGGSEKYGVHVQHRDGSSFDDADGFKNWSAVEDGAMTGAFTASVDVSSLEEGAQEKAFRLVWNSTESNANYTVWIYRNSGGSGNVTIRTISGSNTSTVDFGDSSDECVLNGSASDSRVEFDFDKGEIEGYPSCSSELDVDSAIPEDEERTLSFYRGDNASGEYSVVVNEESALGSGIAEADSTFSFPPTLTNTPYYTHAIWSVQFEVTYQTGRVAYTDTYTLEVYNSSR